MKKITLSIIALFAFTSCSLLRDNIADVMKRHDKTPPVLAISSPNNGADVGGVFSLQGTVSDGVSGVDKVFYSVGANNYIEAVVTDGRFQADVFITNYGVHTNYVYAIDKAGNKSTTISLWVRRSSIPGISISSPVNNFTSPTPNLQVQVIATVDSAEELETIEVRAYGNINGLVSEKIYSVSSNNATIWATVLNLDTGANTIEAKVISDSGKTATATININFQASAIYVSQDGDDTKSGVSSDRAVLTIQKAINLAVLNNYDNILVEKGLYIPGHGLSNSGVSATITKNNLTLLGGYDNDFLIQNGYSIFDANSANTTIITANAVSNITIDGFVLREATARGLSFVGVSSSAIQNCIISNNGGGGISLSSSYNNTINTTVSGNSISGNGGGIYLTGSHNNTIGGTIYDNTANQHGGGVFLTESHSNTISGIVSSNIANTWGGGILLNNQCRNNIISGTVSGNTAGFDGGGICLEAASGCMYNTISGTVSGNIANRLGGGIYLYIGCMYNTISGTVSGNTANQYGGGVCLYNCNYNTISGTVSGNIASNFGGGICFDNNSDGNTNSATIISNIALQNGGGVYIQSGCDNNTFTSNCVIRWNTATNSGTGGGVWDGGTGNTTNNGTIISDNITNDWYDG